MVVVANHIPAKVVPSSFDVEMVTVDLFNSKFLLSCLYIPPNSCDSYQSAVLSSLLSLTSGDIPVVITGDFNSPDICWSTLSGSSPFSTSLCDLVFSQNLKQFVLCSTHIHGNTLDLVLSNSDELISDLQVDCNVCLDYSDHYLISFSLFVPHSKTKAARRLLFHYSRADLEGLYSFLEGRMPLPFLATRDINSLWSDIKTPLTEARDIFIPSSYVRARTTPPWFTPEIHHRINRIRTTRRKFRLHPSESLHSRLSLLESSLVSLISIARSTYEKSLLNTFFTNSRPLYHFLRCLTGKASIPNCVVLNSVSTSDPHSRTMLFNSFFNSVFTTSDFTLPPIDCMPTPSSQLSSITVTTDEVYTQLSSLDTSKACGCDCISPSLLRLCASAIFDSVTVLFNLSLSSGVSPHEWKVHQITPIFKSGDPHCINNYRPISLLCILSKVLESIVYSKIIDFIQKSLCLHQFGFLKNRSSVSQLLTSFSNIIQNCESGASTDQVFFDFSKAFDSVAHSILLFKLWRIGITGPLWCWFKNYLTDRQHFVQIDGFSSPLLPVKSGVPQGSVLGPLLFLIFINDIPDHISSSALFLFADDSKLQHIASSESDIQHLQADINSLVSWSKSNSLFLNSRKCATIRFSLSHVSEPHYLIDNIPLCVPQSHRDLGVMVRGDLSWSDHYGHICSKAYCSLFLIRRSFSSSAHISVKKQLYLSVVRSKLPYCSQLWRPHLKKDILLLERVQRRATKYILSDYSSNYKDRLISLRILPLMYWLELNDILYLVKALKFPSDNMPILQYISFTNSNTRSSGLNKLKHNYCRTSLSRHFYFNRIIRLWNKLPSIDLSNSILSIKHHLVTHLWNHFHTHFDPSNTCTLHFLCPCSLCFVQ